MPAWETTWALSGGIGSGKSEVRRLFDQFGIRTIDADEVGHSVLKGPASTHIAARWPDVMAGGVVDRAALARIVFADRSELRALEGITHPLIFGAIETELEGFVGAAVVEMPIIATPGGWPRMVVDSEDDTRRSRSIARGMDPDDVDRRMGSQPSRSEWLASADLVIPNHGTLEELSSAVMEVAELLGAAEL